MKKSISLIVGLILVSTTLSATVTKDSFQNVDFIKSAGFNIKSFKDVGGLYAVEASHPSVPRATLFVSKDLKTVVIGKGFTNKGEPIDFPINMEQYKKDAIYTLGNGKNELYLFTDPECSYCQKFEQMSDKLNSDIKLYVFFFPLDFHKNAQQMCKYILSQKDNQSRAKAMKEIAAGNTSYTQLKLSEAENVQYQTIINNHLKIGMEIGVRGTPAVFDSKGNPLQWPELLKK